MVNTQGLLPSAGYPVGANNRILPMQLRYWPMKLEACDSCDTAYRHPSFRLMIFIERDGRFINYALTPLSKAFRRQGNSTAIDQHPLSVPVLARYIRFHPTDRHNHSCLRVEVYGTKGELIRDNIYVQIFVLGSIHMPYFSRVQCNSSVKEPRGRVPNKVLYGKASPQGHLLCATFNRKGTPFIYFP